VGRCEPVTWTAPVGYQEHQPQVTQGPCNQLQEVISDAKSNLDARETQALEKFIAEMRYVFATSGDDFGRTAMVYHRIDTGDARPILQPPRRIPLDKQAEVNDILERKRSGRSVGRPCVVACRTRSEKER
jgi:hypothetical protein